MHSSNDNSIENASNVSEIIEEIQEELINIHIKQLTKYNDESVGDWTILQKNGAKANQQLIIKTIDEKVPILKDYTLQALQEAHEGAKVRYIGEDGKEAIITDIEERADVLVSNVRNELVNNHTAIEDKMINEASSKAILYSSLEQDTMYLRNAIEETLNKDLSSIQTVTLPSGRSINYTSYVEMRVRTDINNIITDTMEGAAQNLGIVFFLCNSFGDCADDHKEFQGKVYYLDGWKEKVKPELHEKYQALIDKQKMKSLGWAKRDGTYVKHNKDGSSRTYHILLGTRPNCRHYFTPITYAQASNSKETLEDLNLKSFGDYDKDKYKAMQDQRKYERQIRELKRKNFIDQLTYTNANGKMPHNVARRIVNRKQFIKSNQAKIRKITGKSYAPRRRYERESPFDYNYNLNMPSNTRQKMQREMTQYNQDIRGFDRQLTQGKSASRHKLKNNKEMAHELKSKGIVSNVRDGEEMVKSVTIYTENNDSNEVSCKQLQESLIYDDLSDAQQQAINNIEGTIENCGASVKADETYYKLYFMSENDMDVAGYIINGELSELSRRDGLSNFDKVICSTTNTPNRVLEYGKSKKMSQLAQGDTSRMVVLRIHPRNTKVLPLEKISSKPTESEYLFGTGHKSKCIGIDNSNKQYIIIDVEIWK